MLTPSRWATTTRQSHGSGPAGVSGAGSSHGSSGRPNSTSGKNSVSTSVAPGLGYVRVIWLESRAWTSPTLARANVIGVVVEPSVSRADAVIVPVEAAPGSAIRPVRR